MDLDAVIALRNNKNRLMGIDYGLARTGISLSDKTWMIASSYDTWGTTSKGFWDHFLTFIKEHDVVAIVLGFPVNMDGSVGPQAQVVEKFAAKLSSHTARPVILWDERWSTSAVERTLIHADLSRSKRAKKIDRAAANYILQGFLDRLNG